MLHDWLKKLAQLFHPIRKLAPLCHPIRNLAPLCHPIRKLAPLCHPIRKLAPLCHPIRKLAPLVIQSENSRHLVIQSENSRHFVIQSQNSRHFVIQSEVLKPIVTHSHTFSRASRQLPVFASGFDWFTGFSFFLMIGQSNNFCLALRHSIENRSNWSSRHVWRELLSLIDTAGLILRNVLYKWIRVLCYFANNTIQRMPKLETYRIGMDYEFSIKFLKQRSTAGLMWRKPLFTKA